MDGRAQEELRAQSPLTNRSDSAFAVLRRFARNRRAEERCELCGAALTSEHPHLIELAERKLLCACDACALLFEARSSARYKRVSRRILLLDSFKLTDAQWDGLMIPINLAFFFFSSLENKTVAFYPSPAGPVESLLSLETWQEILRQNPALAVIEPDVESLLVNRVGHARESSPPEYFIAPVDECYRLVGLIRTNWRGLSGGTEVWHAIGQFFSGLRRRAEVLSEQSHA